MKKMFHNVKKLQLKNCRWLAFACLALVAILFAVPTLGLSLIGLIAPKFALAVLGVAHKGVACATMGVFGCGRILLDKAGDVGGGADLLDKIDKGVTALGQRQDKFESAITKVTGDLDRADKEVKAALEELTKVKNTTNSTFEECMKKMEKVQRAVALNARSSFRNPVERALANEELRFSLNAAARYIVALASGEMDRLDPAFKKHVAEAMAKHKSLTGVDAGVGQATVPQETFNEIYDLLLEYGDYSTLGVMRLGMRTTVLPIATSRPQFYWMGAQTGGSAEGAAITAGALAGSQVLLIVQTLAVLMYISRELLADSSVDLAPWVLHQMVESCNWGMDTAAFIGTGNADQINAGYVGIFNAPLANVNLACVAAAGRTTVGTTKLDDWVNTILTVSPQVLNRKPMWWLHSQQLARVSLIRDNNGRPIFQTWLEVPKPGSIGSILGYPVHPTAIAPTTDGAAQPIAAFGDPSGQAVGIRSDLELATSSDIGFPQNLMAYRTLIRAGVQMKTAAASTTLKPFAVLQTAPN